MDLRQDFMGWDPPRSILVLHDLSPQAGHAAWRAGMIARDHGAQLELLHASCAPGAAADVRPALERFAADLARHLAIEVRAQAVGGDPLAAVVREGRGTDLLVLGAQRGNVLREWVFGTQAERLIRLCGRPVLVVKRPATAGYRRVLVPVDRGPGAAGAVAAAAGLSRGTRIEVFHSLSTLDELGLRAADVPEAEVRRRRQRAADRTRSWMAELIGSVPGAQPCALPCIGFGDASQMVLAKEQAMRADLVVIGKRRRGLLADFFLGSVTQRVLAAARSDVLVLPARLRREGAGWRLDRQPA